MVGVKYSLNGAAAVAEELQVTLVSQRCGSKALRKELAIQFDPASG